MADADGCVTVPPLAAALAGDGGLNAIEACAGCGGTTPPSVLRTLNTISASCRDHTATDGSEWRDSYGYTCSAYHHGGFCSRTPQGEWTTVSHRFGWAATVKGPHGAVSAGLGDGGGGVWEEGGVWGTKGVTEESCPNTQHAPPP